MKKAAVRGGHNFKATGAVGLINEVVEDRKVKDAVIKYLRKLGYEVLDITPDNLDTNADLAYGVNKANSWGADLFISIHFNKAYNTYNGAIGTESWIYKNNSTKEISDRVCNKIASLGFKNRGTKFKTTLYELANTTMPAIIIEVCFVEATEDVEIYKRAGADKIGQVIAEGIANKTIPVEQAPIQTENNIYRIFTDGIQQGTAYANKDNILKIVKECLDKGAKKIEIIQK